MIYERVWYYHNNLGNPPAIIEMMLLEDMQFKLKLDFGGKLRPAKACPTLA